MCSSDLLVLYYMVDLLHLLITFVDKVFYLVQIAGLFQNLVHFPILLHRLFTQDVFLGLETPYSFELRAFRSLPSNPFAS